MRRLILWISVLTVGFSVLTGYTSLQRRQQINDGICSLDNTFVKFINKGLSETKLTEAISQPDRYRRNYKLSAALERELISKAPCTIKADLPPNLLGR